MAETSESSTIRKVLRKHQRYLMVYIAFVELFIVTGPLYNYSVLFVSFQQEFHSSAALTGWVGSLANAALGLSGPFCAPFVLRFGPRTMILVGAVMFSIGLAATSFVPSLVYTYFTFGTVVGVGAGVVVQAAMTLIIDWFPGKSCSRGTSMALLGTSFCVLIIAPLFNTLISAYGWRNALRIASGGSLVTALVHGFFIVESAQFQTSRSITEEGSSYKMVDTDTMEKVDGDPQRHVTETVGKRIFKLLHQIEAWLWLAAATLNMFGWTFVIINFASFMEYDLHFTADQVSITFVLFAVGEIVGKLIFSAVGDRIPVLKVYVVAAGSFLAGAAAGLMILLQTVPLIYTVATFTGLIRAACFTMPYPAVQELFGEYGADIVVMLPNVPYSIGVLTGAPISGLLYDLTGDYTLSLVIVLATFTCSVGLLLIIPVKRRIQTRRKRTKIPPETDEKCLEHVNV